MKSAINKIRYLGIQEDQSLIEQRSIMLLNEIAFILFVLEAFVYPEFIIPFKLAPVLIVFVVQLFTAGCLVLTYFNKTNEAKWYFNIVYPLFMTGLIATHGWEMRADYSYLVFTVTAVIFFRNNIHRLFLIVYIIISYFFVIFYIENYPTVFAEHVTEWNKVVMFLAVILAMIVIISRFIRDNEAYQMELKSTLDNLQAQQIEIEQQNKTLASVNKDLERFAYISSHNLKTPIRTIRSFTDLIERDLKRGKQDDLMEYFDFVKQGASQMQLLVTDILEYSKFNQQDNFEMTNVDLNDTIYFIHSQLQTFTDKEIVLEVEALPIIQSNKTFINAIFQNLIENGVKYNESEQVNIKITYEDKGNKHLLAFEDNGIGIEEAYQERIFKMFERLHNNTKYTGSGVGLGMTKKIIEKLNGRIWMTSKPTEGSTFYVELPKLYL